MIELEYDNGLIKQSEAIEKLLASDADMEKKMRSIIGRAMKRISKEVSSQVKTEAKMKSDPREAYKAVKYQVYKKVLGANISILNRKKRSGSRASVTSSKRKRSEETEKNLTWWGEDRAFVLRFLNSGTKNRYTGRQEGWRYKSWRHLRWAKEAGVNIGRRGAISPRNFFPKLAWKGLQNATKEIERIINEEVWSNIERTNFE